MKHGCRVMIVALAAVVVALNAGCHRGGKKKTAAKPPIGTSKPTKPEPTGGPPVPLEPPKVEPGDIAGKARVVFGFYREKGPLTPRVRWDKSEGRLAISHIHSLVNIGPRFNTRVAAEKVSASGVRSLLANYLTITVEKLPEVKVLELHVLFKDKDVGRLTASRQEMKDAIAAADAVGKKRPGRQPWLEMLLKSLPGAWVSPKLSD